MRCETARDVFFVLEGRDVGVDAGEHARVAEDVEEVPGVVDVGCVAAAEFVVREEGEGGGGEDGDEEVGVAEGGEAAAEGGGLVVADGGGDGAGGGGEGGEVVEVGEDVVEELGGEVGEHGWGFDRMNMNKNLKRCVWETTKVAYVDKKRESEVEVWIYICCVDGLFA